MLLGVTNVRCACLKQCSLSEPVVVEHLRFLSRFLMIILKYLIVKSDINHTCHRRPVIPLAFSALCALALIRRFIKNTVSTVSYDGFTTGRIKTSRYISTGLSVRLLSKCLEKSCPDIYHSSHSPPVIPAAFCDM